MACSFSINNFVKKKFSGLNFKEYPEWLSQWKRADKSMTELLFSEEDKFSCLKSALSDLALSYVTSLPLDSPESYRISLATLHYMHCGQKNTLQTEIQKLLSLQSSTGTFDSRQKVHSALVNFSNTVAAMGATDEHIALGFQLVICGRVLDPSWQKDLVKFMNKNRDMAHPLGAQVNFHDIISVLFQSMMEQQQIKAFGNGMAQRGAFGGGQPPQRNAHGGNQPPQAPRQQHMQRGRSGLSAAAAGKSDDQKALGEGGVIHLFREDDELIQGMSAGLAGAKQGSQNRGASKTTGSEIKVACIFCAGKGPNAQQKYQHTHPLNCVKIKSKMLSMNEIKTIVIKANACKNCASAQHAAQDCNAPDFIYCRFKDPETNRKCGRRHMTCFHPNPNRRRVAAAAQN